MKKIITLFLISSLLSSSAFSQQVFQATLVNSGSQLIFKIRPTTTITTAIAYIEFAFRYNTASTPPFTITNITSNTATFPGLDIQSFPPNYDDGTYTYVKYIFNTGTIPSATYTGGTEYTVFTVDLQGAPSTFANIDLVSNSIDGNYEFGVLSGSADLISTAAGTELYGPGEFTSGNDIVVPLSNIPLPVKFLSFTAAPQDGNAVLNWTVANEGSTTKNYRVERSTDNGASYVTLDTIAVTNPNATSNSYSYTDATLATAKVSSNTIYYRIEQVDADGKSIYSSTQSIHLSSEVQTSVSVYPNPAKDVVHISFNLSEAAPVSLELTDNSGRVLQTQQYQGTAGANLLPPVGLASYATGNYLLRLHLGTEVKVVSLVKSN